MSRTYRRRDHVERDCNCGAPIWTSWGKTEADMIASSRRHGTPPMRECRCDTYYYDNHKRNYKRDRKDYFKPDKNYKTVTKKLRKAKERAAMQKHDYDNIPRFRNSDEWDWN